MATPSAVSGRTDIDYFVENIDSFDYFEPANYTLENGVNATVGIRNLFDESPPELDMWNSWEANTFPNMYDVYGRSIFARLKYKFSSI